MNVPPPARYAALLAFAALATACAGAIPPPSSGAGTLPVAPARAAAPQKNSEKLTVLPSKLDFTTSKKLTLTVSETNYTGSFTIADSSSSIVKVSKTSATGPGPVKITVTAKSAGAATITVSDKKGGKAKIPVSVTSAVVIVN